MFTVCVMNSDHSSYSILKTFSNYIDARGYADSIATKPVYGRPDPDGVYVLIFDEDHDSPRYTSW